jgi:rhamnose utilization protein RhaD (predicted bifunctional aldolase and dehydrogenase)/NAD(P)-dependent dehydrogenase (short-subunit alcohol dehydrogenase family)
MDSLYRAEEAERAVAAAVRHDDTELARDVALRTYTARLLGQEPRLVLHGGGNTSVKSRAVTLFGETVDVLCVKGSGWDLATIEPAGHPACRLDALLALASLPTLSDEAMVNGLRLALLDAGAPTPSIETLLHALLPGKFVDHTHANSILALVDQPDSERICREVFPRGLVWVPYVMPGFALARACKEAWDATVAKGETPSVMVLDRHGIFTFGETAQASYESMIAAVTRAERYAADRTNTASIHLVKEPPGALATGLLPALRGALAEAGGLPEETGPVLALRDGERARAVLGRKDLHELTRRGSATPDHVIRTKPWPLLLPALPADAGALREAVSRAVASYRADSDTYFKVMCAAKGVTLTRLDPSPAVVLVPGLGVIAVGATRAQADAAADIYEHTIDVMEIASDVGEYTPLAPEELFDVEYWSLEQAKLRKQPAPSGALAGKIALVTGAASGIGRETARMMLSEGAHVLLADRAAAVDDVRADLARMYSTRVCSARCDVTAEQSIAALFERVTRELGGLDVCVSNAGTAPEGALDTDAGLAALQRSLDENLLSHARVARYAAEIFRAQGRGGCLLFNASKSAFAPGPGFGPYAIAKAALVALTRQLAIDLASVGVRANAVNADRVRTALFGAGVLESRAKARGLTPDAYFRANLLAREVTPADVARAFVHLATARATTGAILPVDGGNPAAFPR